jgi:RecB family exonuclease
MKFSASMLNTWMECPKKAHFKEILKVKEEQHAKTTFGTCVHSALELYNTIGDVDMAITHFEEIWADPSAVDAEIDIWPSNLNWIDLRDRGLQAIRKFHEDSRWEKRNIIANEYKFLVPFGDHELSGIIDNLELTGPKKSRELRVVDYKTSSRLPSQLQLRFSLQFTIYLYATTQREFWIDIEGGAKKFEELKDAKRRGVWYAIWQNRALDVGPRNDLDMQRLYRLLLEVEQAVEKEVYVPNISGESCLWCPYTRVCAATIPLAEEIELAKSQYIK